MSAADAGGVAEVALELLYEPPGLPALPLPSELERRYGGSLGFEGHRVFANFVSTVDGVVAMPSIPHSNQLVSGSNEADRLVMALLRACADAILIGSGTLRASPGSTWLPESAYPSLAASFAELREGRPARPALAIVTASGEVDPAHPAFERGAVVLTTEVGAERLRGRLPAASEVEALGTGAEVDLSRALGALRARGHSLVLVEAGPHVMGSLLEARLVDELFLTLSPVVAGRGSARCFGLVEGVELLPDVRLGGRLLGVRRAGEHLFLRYAVE